MTFSVAVGVFLRGGGARTAYGASARVGLPSHGLPEPKAAPEQGAAVSAFQRAATVDVDGSTISGLIRDAMRTEQMDAEVALSQSVMDETRESS